jgi:hypothetical protein
MGDNRMRLGRTSELVIAGCVAFAGTMYVLIPPGKAESEWASTSSMIREQMMSEGDVRPLSPSASRVALTALSMGTSGDIDYTFAALTAEPVGEFDLGDLGTLQLAIMDETSDDIAVAALSVQGGEYSPLVFNRGDREPTLAVNLVRSYEAPGGVQNLDISLTHNTAVSIGPDGSAAGSSAEVRIGQYMRVGTIDRPNWYLFAGAGKRALLYDPSQGMDFSDALALDRREVIGDLQAGMAVRYGGVDWSVAYVRREYRHVAGTKSFDESENFGAVTMNWRW